jgi:hypothetical protein
MTANQIIAGLAIWVAFVALILACFRVTDGDDDE